MKTPVSFLVSSQSGTELHWIKIDPRDASKLTNKSGGVGPSVVVTQRATILNELKAGLIDPKDVLSVTPGDWSNTAMIIISENAVGARSETDSQNSANSGDGAFLSAVEETAPHLLGLAKFTLEKIRGNGISGELVKEGERWVNRPINSFTLKAQPRVGNIHFTLYGNPNTFVDALGDDGFLLKDQNSYSRGWVRSPADAARLAALAAQSHRRRSHA